MWKRVKTVAASEARTYFACLLKRAAKGERVVITKYGTPIACLVPFSKPDSARTRRAISRLKTSRKGRRLNGLSWKVRDTGRC